MGSVNYRASDYRDWDAAGLKDFGDYSECVEYREQSECYGDSLEGGWFYGDDDSLTIYTGTFGNDHSPGASHYTAADVYDDPDEYRAEVKRLDFLPEYLDDDSDDDDEASTYEVICGNVGTVYDGPDRDEADRIFDEYVKYAQTPSPLKVGEPSVTMFEHYSNGTGSDIVREHIGDDQDIDSED